MSGRVLTRLHPEPSFFEGSATYLGPPLLPSTGECGFRSVAGFGGPSGVSETLDEWGRREQATVFKCSGIP
ncbi:hypothetical protein GCM10010222_40600 [Streptomyces tanashiensis]|nr:hypothetical protein GCM10010222_40600 [Streptomyces tanashiensis]